jgi:hypothetical protein
VSGWGMVDKFSHSHVVVSTLLVFRRVVKDSRLSRLGHTLLLLPFAIPICGTLGLDLLVDDSTYECHARARTQGGFP